MIFICWYALVTLPFFLTSEPQNPNGNTYIVGKHTNLETGRKASLWHFRPISLRVQMNFIFADNVCILRLSSA